MTRILVRYLRPYKGPLALVVTLLLVQSLANLYLPDLNADIINNGVVKGDTGYIVRTGGLMLAASRSPWASPRSSPSTSAAKVAMAFGRDVRAALFRKVESFSQVEINHFGTASLITRNTNDVQQVQMVVLMGAHRHDLGADHGRRRRDHGPARGRAALRHPGRDHAVMALVIGSLVRRAMPLFRVDADRRSTGSTR